MRHFLALGLLLLVACGREPDQSTLEDPAASDGSVSVDVDPASARKTGTEESGELDEWVIALSSAGIVRVGDKTLDLSDPGRLEQERVLRGFRAEMLRIVEKHPELREPNAEGKPRVVVRGHRDAKWVYVKWMMQVCAHPTIGIPKLRFEIQESDAK